MVTRRPHKDQLGKVSSEVGTAHKLKMKKRKKAGEKGTKWQHSGVERRRIEGSSLKLEAMQKVPELVVQERRSHGKGVKGLKEIKKVPGWSPCFRRRLKLRRNPMTHCSLLTSTTIQFRCFRHWKHTARLRMRGMGSCSPRCR